MLKLHHSLTCRSIRIKWLLEELGLPYDVKEYNFYNAERVAPEFLKINPGGTFPVLEDDGLILTESGAIINYVLRKYGNGRFRPAEGSPEQAMVDQWMFWAEGNFAIQQRYFWDHAVPPPACLIDPIESVGLEGKKQAIKYSLQLELALRDTGYAVGDDLTGADFMLCFPVLFGDYAGFFEKRPKIRAYLKRLLARPAFARAVDASMENLKTLFINPEFKSFREPEALVDIWK